MARPLYLIYNLLSPLLALVFLAGFALSPRRRLLGNFFRELGERLTPSMEKLPARPVWIHAASVGEVRSLPKLAAALKERMPGAPLLITCSTWAGRTEALKLTPHARLLPLDFYPLMRAFCRTANPSLLLIAETEIWPGLVLCCRQREARIFFINARMSARSFRSYRLLRPILAWTLSMADGVLAQTPGDAERYGYFLPPGRKAELTGNIKYDLVEPDASKEAEITEGLRRAGFANKPVFCAASTHPLDEEAVLRAFTVARESLHDLKLVLAPRHPERAGDALKSAAKAGLKCLRWKDRDSWNGEADCILMDEMGWLAGFYPFCEAVFVGGTIAPVGGHNLLEPAAAARPVFFGRNYANALTAGKALLASGGGFLAADGGELAARLKVLLHSPTFTATAGKKALEALRGLQGATEKTLRAIG
ncbi:MAG: 3-deoxy-D-manno-octulosonic-acid transferase [Elusimicrobia bacterium]|nr:MAG: 3-deoxy-D-manno-octulosonic-acid transferase [Elusimicrobiota bacterium]KAF0156607.1 MAG: 3-deoxy-D-manno-octulosonic-acid transferase [Elusimicrobiota bacterium]